MNRTKFIRDLSKYCLDNNMSTRFVKSEGKGSHGTLYITDAEGNVRKTILKKGELTRTYCNVVLRQLGFDKDTV